MRQMSAKTCCLVSALRPSLLQGGSVGLEHFEGVVAAAASAMRSPLDEDLSVSATWTLQSVAKRLAEAPQAVSLSPVMMLRSCFLYNAPS